MAKQCEICGKKTVFGRNISHAHNVTSRTMEPNLQRVHTLMRFTDLPTRARTRCRFGIQRRDETLWAWLIRFPNTGALPQTSQVFAMEMLLK